MKLSVLIGSVQCCTIGYIVYFEALFGKYNGRDASKRVCEDKGCRLPIHAHTLDVTATKMKTEAAKGGIDACQKRARTGSKNGQ